MGFQDARFLLPNVIDELKCTVTPVLHTETDDFWNSVFVTNWGRDEFIKHICLSQYNSLFTISDEIYFKLAGFVSSEQGTFLRLLLPKLLHFLLTKRMVLLWKNFAFLAVLLIALVTKPECFCMPY